MDEMILTAMTREFQLLAAEAGQGKDCTADLVALVERLREAAGSGTDWQTNVERVREQLKAQEHTLSAPDPALPDKLTIPYNQRQHAFYADAIAHLTALVGGE